MSAILLLRRHVATAKTAGCRLQSEDSLAPSHDALRSARRPRPGAARNVRCVLSLSLLTVSSTSPLFSICSLVLLINSSQPLMPAFLLSLAFFLFVFFFFVTRTSSLSQLVFLPVRFCFYPFVTPIASSLSSSVSLSLSVSLLLILSIPPSSPSSSVCAGEIRRAGRFLERLTRPLCTKHRR